MEEDLEKDFQQISEAFDATHGEIAKNMQMTEKKMQDMGIKINVESMKIKRLKEVTDEIPIFQDVV